MDDSAKNKDGATGVEHCPACGAALKTRTKLEISVLDVVGAGVVLLFILVAFYFVIRNVDWLLLVTGVGALLLVSFIFVYGEGRKVERRVPIGNAWDGVHGLLGALLLVLLFVTKYFINYEFVKLKYCPVCGYHEGRK